ncbi:MAG: RagB/SusD family nutrient uptake outer membrane protein [Prolixibacteraceae bacterium]|nr:RagB/SusD family nutrient uptake outer membrane protein [Prolixibacteraceae bacterium]
MKQIIQKRKNLGVLVTLIFIIISSCNESFLEPKPLSFYAPENVLTNEEGLQAVLNKALTSLRVEMSNDQAPFLVNMKYSDVAVDGSTDKATPWQDLNSQMLPDGILDNYAHTRIGWYWDDSYKVIKDCNTVITRIDDAEFSSEARKNTVLGGAYFLRAYRYYAKTLQYGDVPLVLEEIREPCVDFVTTTKESIWKKMIRDLEFAVQHVPEANEVPRGQVTKAACKHLLAKYYLLEGRFDDAIKQTSDVINGGVHSLKTQRFGIDKNIPGKDVIWDLHRVENKSVSENSEGLLMVVERLGEAITYSAYNSANAGYDIFGTNSMRNVVPNFGLAGMIKTPNGAIGLTDKVGVEIGLVETYGRGIARLRPSGYTQRDVWMLNGEMDWQDYRHNKDNGNWITMESLVYNNPALKGKNEWYGKNLRLYSDDGTLLCIDTIRCWFQWPHYKVWVPDPDRVQPAGGQGDWYVYRLAETYLLRAESYAWKGEWQKAADDINIIRQRANAKYMYTAADIQQQGIGAILDERNRELYYEELRKVELTRMAITFARTGIKCYNGKSYTMENISQDNFWYDRVNEISDLYNKNAKTGYGNYFTCSPYHIFWPIPSYAINANTGGIINQNEGYPGTGKNIPPLVYEGE